jgi:hypothetical protein
MGGFVNGTAVLSLAGAGGNYEGTDLRNALLVPVDAPSMLLSTKSILVHPNGYAIFTINLDTPPSSQSAISVTSNKLMATVALMGV